MLVAPYGRTGTLHNPPGGSCTYSECDQQHHGLRLRLCQAQDQEAPWHFLKNCTHHLTNCMDTPKVSLNSGAPREGPISTTSQPPRDVLWRNQPIGLKHFWHFYGVHALVFIMHSLRQPLFWSLHTVQTPRKGVRYRIQCHLGDHQSQWDRHCRPGPGIRHN